MAGLVNNRLSTADKRAAFACSTVTCASTRGGSLTNSLVAPASSSPGAPTRTNAMRQPNRSAIAPAAMAPIVVPTVAPI